MACVAILGDLNWDVIFHVPGLPRAGGEVLGKSAVFRLGGSATTTGRWLARLGFAVRLLAAVGDDPFGELARRKLLADRVCPCFLKTVPAPSGICLALVDEKGERTLLTYRGANALLGPDLPPGFLDGADWLHLSGYALLEEASRAAFFQAQEEARRRKIPVSVDPGMVFVHHHGHILREAGPVDVFLPNFAEAQDLVGQGPPEKIVVGLSSFAKRVFLKLAEGGCLALAGKQAQHIPGVTLEAKDPVGAGDAFNAGVIAAALWGGGLRAQGLLGNILGALSVAGRSPSLSQVLELLAQVPLPEREEVRALVRQNWPEHVG